MMSKDYYSHKTVFLILADFDGCMRSVEEAVPVVAKTEMVAREIVEVLKTKACRASYKKALLIDRVDDFALAASLPFP